MDDTVKKSQSQSQLTPPWLNRRIAALKARAVDGRIVLAFGDPLIPAAFKLLASGAATVTTDHARRVHILELLPEGER